MATHIEVEGVARFQRTTGAAGRKLTALAKPNRDVAGAIRAAADPPRRTGRLAGSLTVHASNDEASVSSGLVYAPVIEYGWRAHGIAATHFLANAEASRRASTLDTYDRHCRASIRGVKGA